MEKDGHGLGVMVERDILGWTEKEKKKKKVRNQGDSKQINTCNRIPWYQVGLIMSPYFFLCSVSWSFAQIKLSKAKS